MSVAFAFSLGARLPSLRRDVTEGRGWRPSVARPLHSARSKSALPARAVLRVGSGEGRKAVRERFSEKSLLILDGVYRLIATHGKKIRLR